MKLLHDSAIGWCVEVKGARTSLAEFCKQARERQDLTRAAVEAKAGLGNFSYVKFERGELKSINTGLLALEALGYNVFLLGGNK